MGDDGVPGPGADSASCAARGSIRSATATSASSNDGFSPNTRTTSRSCSNASQRRTTRLRFGIASLPETIRGYGRVKEASAAEAAKARATRAPADSTSAKTPMEMAA